MKRFVCWLIGHDTREDYYPGECNRCGDCPWEHLNESLHVRLFRCLRDEFKSHQIRKRVEANPQKCQLCNKWENECECLPF